MEYLHANTSENTIPSKNKLIKHPSFSKIQYVQEVNYIYNSLFNNVYI